ncbi:MAG: hypothetical protein JSR90_15015 [Proteobacteria bacterium]|nr:hypothetical protein [Pseudomonadota bacterium]
MTFLRAPLRFLVSPIIIAALDLLILFPMVLSVFDVAKGILAHVAWEEPVNIVSTVATIMIGWGVALESREVIRKVSGHHGRADEERQSLIDGQCNSFGVAQLVLGLFAEISVAMISLPDRIINVSGYEGELLGVSIVLISIGALIQARHIVLLLTGR